MENIFFKNLKIKSSTSVSLVVILTIFFSTQLFGMAKPVHAICSPQVTKLEATPKTISKAKPTTALKLTLTGVDTCASSELKTMEAYVIISGTTHKIAAWNLGDFVEVKPGQTQYFLESIVNIFAAVPGTDVWKNIILHPGIRVNSIDTKNDAAKIQLSNASGTSDSGGAFPILPADSKVDPAAVKPSNTNTVVVNPVKIAQIDNPFGAGANTVPGIINRVINVLLALIVIAAVVVIVISGFRMVASGGNPEQLKKAKTGIIWAIVGIVVAFMSFAIVQIIQRIL